MSIDTLRHNIGRLCMDALKGTMYMIVGVECNINASPKYILYNVQSGVRFSLYVNALDNPSLVKWLTQPHDHI
jgi:hypothetical protein